MAKQRADCFLWRGPAALLAAPPVYSPGTVAELAECLLDLQAFSATTTSNFEVLKRVTDLREALLPALGAPHPLCRRLEELKPLARVMSKPDRFCRRIAAMREYALTSLPHQMLLVPINPKWR